MLHPVELGVKLRYIPESNYFSFWNDNKTERFLLEKKEGFKELPIEESEFYDVSLGTFCLNNCPFCYTSAKQDGVNYEDPSETWLKLYNKLWWKEKIKDSFEFKERYEIPDGFLIPVAQEACFNRLYQDFKHGNKFIKGIPIISDEKIARLVINKANTLYITNAPYQIAIGSGGEGTEHPDFCKFLETVYKTGVIPNYTTAGRIIGYSGNDGEMKRRRDSILDYTEKYSGGVAVSFGNSHLRKTAEQAIHNLLEIKTKVVIHHLIDTNESVDEMLRIRENYGRKIHYHVLLPLVHHGRSNHGMNPEVYKYLMQRLEKFGRDNIKDIAFGAKFIKYLQEWNPLRIEVFPEQTYSKNLILEKDKAIFTPSSFDLTHIKEIQL